VERHLEGCDECRDEIRAFRSVREDLLAWGVPNPPSVWTPFAPVPVVAWHRQVPAWALAAAASVMLVLGSAGGFLAHTVAEGRSPEASGTVAAAIPADVVKTAGLDADAIVALVREELATADRVSARMTPGNTPGVQTARLDSATEQRILTRVSELVNASQERQLGMVGDYLYKVAQEDDRRRRDDGRRLTMLSAQVDQLQAQVSQLLLAQAKGQ
jgi:hypothetical protein